MNGSSRATTASRTWSRRNRRSSSERGDRFPWAVCHPRKERGSHASIEAHRVGIHRNGNHRGDIARGRRRSPLGRAHAAGSRSIHRHAGHIGDVWRLDQRQHGLSASLQGELGQPTPDLAAALESVKSHQRDECSGELARTRVRQRRGHDDSLGDENVDAWLERLNPEVAVVMFGTNDLTRLEADEYDLTPATSCSGAMPRSRHGRHSDDDPATQRTR